MWKTVLEFFREEKFKIEVEEENKSIFLFISGVGGTWMGLLKVYEEGGQIVFYSAIPTRVPAENRWAVMEFITRANYNLLVGNFEMDFDDGEVRFKTSIDVSGETLTPGLVKNIVYFNLIAMDRYLESLMTVMYGGKKAKDAFEEAIKKPGRE